MKDFGPCIDSLSNYNLDASKSSQRDHKIDAYEYNGLVHILWRDTITLYDEQIEFKLLSTYLYRSANINRTSTVLVWHVRTNLIGLA